MQSAYNYQGHQYHLVTHVKIRQSMADTSVVVPPSSPDFTEALATLSGSKVDDMNTCDRSIARFFEQNTPLAANSAHSQAISNTIACKQLVHILEARFKIPRPFFPTTQIPVLYNKVQREVVESLSDGQRVAITVDGWTSCAT